MKNQQRNIIESDVIVIGGGPIGLSCAYQIAKRGRTVVLLEQFPFFHQRGSSADHVRMWRVMYTELHYAKLAIAAGHAWRELEKETGNKLLHMNGLLNFGIETSETPEGTLETAADIMDELGLAYTRLNAKQIEQRYPFSNLPHYYQGIFQADAGTLNVNAVLKSLYFLARKQGVDLRENQAINQMKLDTDTVIVESESHSFYAKKLVLCTGAFTNSLLNQLGIHLNLLLWQMVYAYYQCLDNSANYPMWFQFDNSTSEQTSQLFYGFPPVDWALKNYIRVAVDWASHTFFDPKERNYFAHSIDIDITRQFIKKHMRGVDPIPVGQGTCIMPHLCDNGTILDFLPDSINHNKNVILCMGGWIFKFAPVLGNICADLAINGETSADIAAFSINRAGMFQAA